MLQLILHLTGDYVLQSGWMADNKTKRSWPAFCHALVYSLPFLLIGSIAAFAVILGTHFLIDRFRLARYVAWGKNIVLSPAPWDSEAWEIVAFIDPQRHEEWLENERRMSWANCQATGYPSELPPFLAVWLLIACDNTMHLAINYAALRWL